MRHNKRDFYFITISLDSFTCIHFAICITKLRFSHSPLKANSQEVLPWKESLLYSGGQQSGEKVDSCPKISSNSGPWWKFVIGERGNCWQLIIWGGYWRLHYLPCVQTFFWLAGGNWVGLQDSWAQPEITILHLDGGLSSYRETQWYCYTYIPWGGTRTLFYHCTFVSFPFLGPHLQCMEVSRIAVVLEQQLLAYTTAMTTPDLSRICDLHHSLKQCWILNPLNRARDQICILMDTSQPLSHSGNSYTVSSFLLLCFCIPSLFWLEIVWICPLELGEGQGGWVKPIP